MTRAGATARKGREVTGIGIGMGKVQKVEEE
jgi:hypothetical protein